MIGLWKMYVKAGHAGMGRHHPLLQLVDIVKISNRPRCCSGSCSAAACWRGSRSWACILVHRHLRAVIFMAPGHRRQVLRPGHGLRDPADRLCVMVFMPSWGSASYEYSGLSPPAPASAGFGRGQPMRPVAAVAPPPAPPAGQQYVPPTPGAAAPPPPLAQPLMPQPLAPPPSQAALPTTPPPAQAAPSATPPAEAAPSDDAAGSGRDPRSATGRHGGHHDAARQLPPDDAAGRARAAGEPHASSAAAGDLTSSRYQSAPTRAGEAKPPPRPVSRGRPRRSARRPLRRARPHVSPRLPRALTP